MRDKDVDRIFASIMDLAEECNRMAGRIDRLRDELISIHKDEPKTKYQHEL